jgi:hypothetical protein
MNKLIFLILLSTLNGCKSVTFDCGIESYANSPRKNTEGHLQEADSLKVVENGKLKIIGYNNRRAFSRLKASENNQRFIQIENILDFKEVTLATKSKKVIEQTCALWHNASRRPSMITFSKQSCTELSHVISKAITLRKDMLMLDPFSYQSANHRCIDPEIWAQKDKRLKKYLSEKMCEPLSKQN